ncbi:3'-5' exonuclease [Parendozoicomonas sp. Alg238-R29]|uniref:3'-5' exonuclease n=1 Tax=Parendozoicomonas sp. Alg238-R29 TaxID=2993446 RepID=UPI00248DD10E|nr:3'-5' exonuclease [Parendozoicomonas sp. Alg238-R29]
MDALIPDGLRYRWYGMQARNKAIFSELFPPLGVQEYVSLDLETSSLDTETAEILEIAAVPVRQGKVFPGESLVIKVKPFGRLDPDSVPIHQIRSKDLESAMDPERALGELLKFLGRRPLLGFNIRFDQLIINRYCKKYYGFKFPNLALELSHAYYRWVLNKNPEGVTDLRFETICTELGVPVFDRHTAKGDALSVALAWLKMK